MAMGQPTAGLLKLGKIGFLNVLPIYFPLEAGIISHPFRIVSGDPAQLNHLMQMGKLDLSAVSSIEYARHPDRYLLVPDLSISSRGPANSVLLLSQAPLEELRGQTVLVSAGSHTSVALLKILFARRQILEVRFQAGYPSRSLASGDNAPLAMLVIGDEALQLKHHPGYPHQWDLGEMWHAWIGLPFVFGLWVVQRTALKHWNGKLTNAVQSLIRAKNWGLAHLETVCEWGARQGLLDQEELRSYYTALGFNLRQSEIAGLQAFFRSLLEIGEIPAIPSLEFCFPLASVA
jgi:chorismate dehydratase